MKAAAASRPKHTIPAVCKAMELLGLLAAERGETTTKALALRLGVPRTTCYRLLRSLVARDWVRPLPGGGHALSVGLLPLLQLYYELGFDGPVRVDHVPTMAGESNERPGYESLGRRFAIGYTKGVLQAL